MVDINTILFWVLGGLGLAYFLSGFRVVRPTERGLVERFGKYNRYVEPGLTYIFTFVDRLIVLNVTEILVEAEPQQIITKDKLNARVDAQVYFKIKADEENVKNSQYNVNDAYTQIVNLARTTLRNIIGSLTLNEANSKRDTINLQLLSALKKETKNWGIEIVRTELKEIDPPTDVQDTMNKVVKAENEKQAAVDTATALETQADGRRRAAIKEADGQREAAILRARGTADAIKLINESANKYFVGNAKELKKLEVTQASLQNNSKVIITEKGISPMIVLGDDKIVPVKENKTQGIKIGGIVND